MATRKTVGLFINDTTGSTNYENDLWNGAHDAAVQRDADLIAVVGSDFSEKARTGKGNPRNYVYDFYRPESFDGVVLATTTVCMGLESKDAVAFAERFSKRPFVMVNGFPGKHRSLVDNRSGVYETISHLIETHGKRRIGYIRGPEGTEADERFAAYRKALEDHDLPYDDSIVYVGKFLQSSGIACAKEFLEERKVSFDAIAAANDSMAIGMIMGLKERGIRVPADVAVVGFDDIEAATFFNPPLTTVKQPIYAQGYRAVQMALDLIEGKSVERDQALSTEMVLRQSCGCALHSAAGFSGENASGGDSAEAPRKGFRGGEAERAAADSGLKGKDADRAVELSKRVFEAVHDDGNPAVGDSVCAFFDEASAASSDDPAAARAWRKFLRSLDKTCRDAVDSSRGAATAERLSLRLNLSASELMLRAEGKRKITAARNDVALRWLSQSMGTTYEIGEIIGLLNTEFPKNGISGYSLATLDEQTDPRRGPLPLLSQIHAFADGKTVPPPVGGVKIPSSLFFDRSVFAGKRRTIIVNPLAFGESITGIIAMEAATRDGNAFDAVTRQLSSSLEGARLLAESRRSAKRIAERSERIERLVLPMIESLERIARLAAEKSLDVRSIADMAKQSYGRLDGTLGTIEKMSGSIGNMSELIGTIDDISTTINLVSLNASIEASHAGQFGRGFAVIAKEVKKLAESTQTKSSEISASIKTILGNMGTTTASGRQCLDSYRAEENGVKLLIEIFETITKDMGKLAEDGRMILETMKG
jgi:DNA-binding LacI/PurR family transcriptional regulator